MRSLFSNAGLFEVETVLLRTLWVKRNAGRGTPAGCKAKGMGESPPLSFYIKYSERTRKGALFTYQKF